MTDSNNKKPFSDKKSVCVVGGGVAGIAAAVRLARAGIGGTLVEARPFLGGRARSFEENRSQIDNGQHIAMGCYTHFRELLRTLGTEHHLQFTETLNVVLRNKNGTRFTLREAPLPSPFGIALGLLRFRALSLAERENALRFVLRVRKNKVPENFDDLTATEFLTINSQSNNAIRWLWEPIVYATMNSSPRHASAKIFCEVLRRAFFAGGEASRLALPRTGLSELYAKPAQKFLESHGWNILQHATVDHLECDNGKISAVCFRERENIFADAVISALPPLNCKKILPENLVGEISFFAHYQPSPIVSIYAWLREPVTEIAFEGFVGTTFQWMFNHSKLINVQPYNAKQLLTFVASGAKNLVELASDNILSLLYEELRECYPDLGKNIVHSLVIKEKRATFLPTPEAERHRPPAQTSIPNFFLAGDWTATGLPSTLEGAAQSGVAAAECAVRYLEVV